MRMSTRQETVLVVELSEDDAEDIRSLVRELESAGHINRSNNEALSRFTDLLAGYLP